MGVVTETLGNISDLLLIENFVTVDEERDILIEMEQSENRNKKQRNSIKRYGDPYYDTHLESADIPVHFMKIMDRIVFQKLLPIHPIEVTVNEFHKGNALPMHIDKGGEFITTLSLLSEAKIKFSRNKESFMITLPPRSLLRMSGDKRWNWTHEILPVEGLRYSIVFR